MDHYNFKLKNWATTLSGVMLQSSTIKAVKSYRINSAAEPMKTEMNNFPSGTRTDSQMEIHLEEASGALSHSHDPENIVMMGELFEAINLIEEKSDRKGRGRKRKTKGCVIRESSVSDETDGPIRAPVRRARSEEPRTNDKTEASWTLEPHIKRQKK